MTILRKLVGNVSNVIKSEDFWGAWARGEEDLGPTSVAGPVVNRTTAQALAAVWACRNLIAGQIASLPADVFARRGSLREELRPRPAWVDEPNKEQTRFQFLEQVMDSLLLDGTAFIFTPRKLGEVLETWCVHPQHVRVYRRGGDVLYDVTDEGKVVSLRGGLGGEMFHIPAYAAPGALRGMPPLEVARTMIGAGLAAQEFSARFFGQGMNMAGVIEAPGEMEVEQARELKRDFKGLHSGLKRAHLPAVLTAGATWKPITMTAEQAQFLQTRQLSKSDIATFFLVPPHLIAHVEKTTSWGTGIEEQNIGFATYTLRQWIVRLEQAFTRYLLATSPDAFYRLDLDGMLRASIEKRYAAYAIARQWSLANPDELRALEDQPPIADGRGQVYIMPSNFTPIPAPTGGTPDAA